MKRQVKRGDIYYADLGPVCGSEQDGKRPVVIIQNDMGNRFSPTVIVVPVTTKIESKSNLPTHTVIKETVGIDKCSLVLAEQVRTIDKSRLKDYQTTLDEESMKQIDSVLRVSMGL